MEKKITQAVLLAVREQGSQGTLKKIPLYYTLAIQRITSSIDTLSQLCENKNLQKICKKHTAEEIAFLIQTQVKMKKLHGD